MRYIWALFLVIFLSSCSMIYQKNLYRNITISVNGTGEFSVFIKESETEYKVITNSAVVNYPFYINNYFDILVVTTTGVVNLKIENDAGIIYVIDIGDFSVKKINLYYPPYEEYIVVKLTNHGFRRLV